MQKTIEMFQIVRLNGENVPLPELELYEDLHTAIERCRVLVGRFGKNKYGIATRKVTLHLTQADLDEGMFEMHAGQSVRIPFG